MNLVLAPGTPDERRLRVGYIANFCTSAEVAAALDDPDFRDKPKERNRRGAVARFITHTLGEMRQTSAVLGEGHSFQMQTEPNTPPVDHSDLTLVASRRAAGGYIRTRTHGSKSGEFAVRPTGNSLLARLAGMAMLATGLSRIHRGPYIIELQEPVRLAIDGQYHGKAPAGIAEVHPDEQGVVMQGLRGKQLRRASPRGPRNKPAEKRQGPYIGRHAERVSA
jgi:hypothetical protein